MQSGNAEVRLFPVVVSFSPTFSNVRSLRGTFQLLVCVYKSSLQTCNHIQCPCSVSILRIVMDAVKRFFSSPRFAVAGASNDASKFGYKRRALHGN